MFVLLANFLIYIIVCHYTDFSKLSFKKIFSYYAFFSLILLFIWPIASIDIFSYIYQGRIFSIFKMNPYIYSYTQFTQDSFYNIISNRWSSGVSPYGPLFILISGILTWVGSKSLLLSLFLFKALFVGANLLVGYFIYKIAGLKTFFIYALNPLIIFEFIINGHVDVLVVLMIVLSIYFLQKKKTLNNQLLSWVFLVTSALLKITTIIFWPILWLILLKENLKNKTSKPYIILSIITTIIVVAIFYGPFLGKISSLYQPLINQSLLTGYYSLGITLSYLFINIFNYNNLKLSLMINLAIFSILYLAAIFKIILLKNVDCQNDFLKYSALIALVFSLTCLQWFMPWYFIMVIVLSLMSWNIKRKNYYLYTIYFFTLYGILYYQILR